MSISTTNVAVPISGDGPIAPVNFQTGEKTVQLTGTFEGRYVLLGSQNDVDFTPVLTFDSDGKESIKQTLSLALSSVRVRSQASNPVGVTVSVAGVDNAGVNAFGTVASIPVGGSGQQPVVPLGSILPVSSLEQDTCFLCVGSFQGTLIVEGSVNGVDFNPIGDGFRDNGQLPSLLGNNAPLEFSPLVTSDLFYFVRITLNGVALTPITVTIGGSNPTAASAGFPMDLIVSNAGGATLQALGLFRTPAFSPFNTLLGSGNTFNPLLTSTIVVGSENNAGGTGSDFSVVVGNRHTLSSNNATSTLVGYGNGLDNNCDHSILMGSQLSAGSSFAIVIGIFDSGAIPLYRIGASSQDGIVIGHNSTIGNVCEGAVVVGRNLLADNGSGNTVVVGGTLSATLSSQSVIVGFNGSLNESVSSVVVGNANNILNSNNSIAIGISNTIDLTGTVGGTNFAVGMNNSLIDHFHAMSRNAVFGLSNTLGGSTDVGTPTECVIVGLSNTVKAAFWSLIFGENCVLDNTGGTAPYYSLVLGNNHTVSSEVSVTAGYNLTNRGVGGIMIGANSSILSNNDSSISIGNSCLIGDNAFASLCMGGGSIGKIGGVRAENNILIGRTSVIADTTFASILIGGGNGFGSSIAERSPASILLGGSSTIGTDCAETIVFGWNSHVGIASPASIAMHGSIGDNAQRSIVIGASTVGTVGGTHAYDNVILGNGISIADTTGSNVAIGGSGSGISIAAGTSECFAVGHDIVVSGPNQFIIILGGFSTVGAGASGSLGVGAGVVIGDNSPNSIALGREAIIDPGVVSSQAYGSKAHAIGNREVVFNAFDSGAAGINVFHAVSSQAGNPDLLKFDDGAMAGAHDSAMFLLYKDSGGAVVLAQVKVDNVTGALTVPL